jgi:hypothetical protein
MQLGAVAVSKLVRTGPARPVSKRMANTASRLREAPGSTVWVNADGQRIEDGRYAAFLAEISRLIPRDRIITDAVRTFAYGTDASFYRLHPKIVLKVSSEQEIQRILPIATALEVPVTFRAAGTSLSGQAVTDSVMLKLSHAGTAWRACTISGSHVHAMVLFWITASSARRIGLWNPQTKAARSSCSRA